MKRVTIVDVAQRAGVSIKTVSRVINDAPNVSAAVRDRVEQAVAALRYRPNPAARRLPGQRTYLIALVYNDPVSDYIGKLQQGAITRCRESGYNLLLEPVSPGETLPIVAMLERLDVDGLILVPPICDDQALLERLDHARMPYVRITPQTDEQRSALVTMDDELAAFQMTRHLLELGHRRIAFVEGDRAHAVAGRRLAGYHRALAERGIVAPDGYVQPGDFRFPSGYAAAETLLLLPDPPTAIFAANDESALGVLARARRLGLDVPDDLSICGFDDALLATTVWPQLTTVRQPVSEMAAAAADILIGPANRDPGFIPPAIHRILDFKLIVRASTRGFPWPGHNAESRRDDVR